MAMLGGECSKCCSSGLKCYVPESTHGACCEVDGSCNIKPQCECDTENGAVFAGVGETCEGGCEAGVCCPCYREQIRNKIHEIGDTPPLVHSLNAGLVRMSYRVELDGIPILEWDGNNPWPAEANASDPYQYSHMNDTIFGSYRYSVSLFINRYQLDSNSSVVSDIWVWQGGGRQPIKFQTKHYCDFENTIKALGTAFGPSGGDAVATINGQPLVVDAYGNVYPDDSTSPLEVITYDYTWPFSNQGSHTLRLYTETHYLHDGLRNWNYSKTQCNAACKANPLP